MAAANRPKSFRCGGRRSSEPLLAGEGFFRENIYPQFMMSCVWSVLGQKANGHWLSAISSLQLLRTYHAAEAQVIAAAGHFALAPAPGFVANAVAIAAQK